MVCTRRRGRAENRNDHEDGSLDSLRSLGMTAGQGGQTPNSKTLNGMSVFQGV